MFEVGTPNTAEHAGRFMTGLQVGFGVVAVGALLASVIVTFGWWTLLVVPAGLMLL